MILKELCYLCKLGGIIMIKRVLTGALVLVILGTSQATGYAASNSFLSYKYMRNVEQGPVEIISPKGDIITQDSLLISVWIFDSASITMSIYKVDTDEMENALVFGPEKIAQGEERKHYTNEIKDLSPGKYRMVFQVRDKDGKIKDTVIKYFTVNTKDAEISKSLDSMPKMNATNILENILERSKK